MLQKVALGLLDDHVRHRLQDAVRSDPAEACAKFDEITIALHRTLRL